MEKPKQSLIGKVDYEIKQIFRHKESGQRKKIKNKEVI